MGDSAIVVHGAEADAGSILAVIARAAADSTVPEFDVEARGAFALVKAVEVVSYESLITGVVSHICGRHDRARFDSDGWKLVRNVHLGACTFPGCKAVSRTSPQERPMIRDTAATWEATADGETSTGTAATPARRCARRAISADKRSARP